MKTENAETPTRRNAEMDCRMANAEPLAMSAGLERIFADSVVCREATGAPMARVRLSPPNTVKSKNGNYVLDKESWALIEAEFRSHGAKPPIDLEHESEMENLPPKDMIGALGWIEELEFNEREGLIAQVKWNEEGRSRILADRVRYISPVFNLRRSDRKAVRLKSAGLTILPAIEGMERVAAKETNEVDKLAAGQRKDVNMMGEMSTIAGKLGLAADATVEDIMQKIGTLMMKGEGTANSEGKAGPEMSAALLVANAARTALGLKPDAGESEVILAVNSLKQGKESLTAMQGKLTAIETELADRKVDDLLALHGKGKINHADATDLKVCRDVARRDPEEFKKWMASRTVIVQEGRTTPPEGGATGGEKSRETIIVNSAKNFKADPSLHKLTTCKDFVSLALQDAGQARLSDEEAKKIAV